MADEYKRPDPDALLQSIKKEESQNRRGRLKIFFGMAPGVGKTYAMLEAAQHRFRDGADIVIGIVETHRRSETENLVRGLELLPRKTIEYRGIRIEELDIDALLARRPDIALVDELAHTNAEGSRHAKRYQDVLELIDNGISVYTTLNVQHLESQADVVERITGVKIRETIPDSILDLADEIELVDIPTEELLKRLAEGKVYIPERAGIAAERFFKKGNITALREMALHYVARRVDYDLLAYMKEQKIKGPWKTGDRLMVAVSPSPYSEYLVRWTRRMAFNLKSPWVALYIEKQKKLTEEDHERLTKHLNLARELGAEVITTVDENVVSGLLRVAQQQNVTQIVVGKPLRRYVSDLFSGGNLVERLLKSCGDIEIHVVTQPAGTAKSRVRSVRTVPAWGIRDYGIAAGAVCGVTLLNLLLVSITGYWAIGLIYLFSVTLIALMIGRGAVLFAAALSAMAWNFLFIPPLFTFRIDKIHDALMFIMYFVTAIVLGSLTTRLRSKERVLRSREERLTDLYEFSKALGSATGIREVAETAVRYIEKFMDSKATIILADESGGLQPSPCAGSLEMIPKERGVAEWCVRNRRSAGLFTDTIPHAGAHYIPLVAPGSIVGVLGIRPVSGGRFSPEQEGFLRNITYQLSIRIERENLSESSRKALLMEESERLYKILLNSISHELRTPLTAITGAASSILDDAIDARPDTRRALAEEIKKAGDRLNRLVDNLLDMSRLESGLLRLNRQLYDLGDLVSVSMRRLDGELAAHALHVEVAGDMPMIYIDFTLMEQVIVNLVFNAVMHTPAGTVITVGGAVDGDAAVITVSDNGPGLGETEIPVIFEKFSRGARAGTGGTGLGLSICRGIVEAHGGSIAAGNNPGGGARFTIRLPLTDAPAQTREDAK